MYAFIGDLHLGVKLQNEDFMKSLCKFLEIIKRHKEDCRAIFVCGDLFDHRLSVDELKFATKIILSLCFNQCGNNGGNAPVYFVHGTYTHDFEQYEIFMPILEKLDNVNVFYTKKATACTLFHGEKVLFLPQEYDHVPEYETLFKDQYDLIVGHGPIASTTKSPCKSGRSDILHSAEVLSKISKLCVFGHYHGYTDFGNGVYYTGPWLRWRYGEDEPRVFFFCDDNFQVFTEPNPFALEYETIKIHNPEELRDIISKPVLNPKRFIIETSTNEMVSYQGIMDVSKSNPNLKFQWEIEDIEDDLKLSVDDTMDSQMEHQQPLPALISFIQDKYGINAEEQLKEYESQIQKEEIK